MRQPTYSLIAAVAALMAGPALSQELRVQCYSDGNECEVTQDLAKRFEAQNAGVKVVIDKVPYKAILETAAGAARRGRRPRHRARHRSRRPVEVLPRHHAVREGRRSTGRPTSARRCRGCAPAPGDKGIYGMMTQLTVTGAVRQQDAVRAGQGAAARAARRRGTTGPTRRARSPRRRRRRSRWRWTAAAIASRPRRSAWARRSSTPRATWSSTTATRRWRRSSYDWNRDGTMPKEVWGGVGGSQYRDAFEEFANGRVVHVPVGQLADQAHGHADRQELRLDRRARPLRPGGVHRHARRRRVRGAEAHQESEGRRPSSSTSWRASRSTRSTWRAPRTSRRTPASRRRASTTTSRRRPRPRSTSFVADVPKLVAGRLRDPGLQAQPRDVQSDGAAARAGDRRRNVARRRAEAHQRGHRRAGQGRGEVAVGGRCAAPTVSAARHPLLALPRPRSAAAFERVDAPMRALQRLLGVPRIGWLFVAPNLADPRPVHVPADRHQLLLRVHRRRAALSVAAAVHRAREPRDAVRLRRTTSIRRPAARISSGARSATPRKFALLQVGADGAVRAGHRAGAQSQDPRPRLLPRRVLLSRCCCRRSSSR